MEEQKSIAVTIQNLVQFYTIKNGIDALINNGYLVDIYVPIDTNKDDWNNMYDSTYNHLINLGYTPLRKTNTSKKYKILLEAYPLDIYFNFDFQYRIKYKYAPLPAKPNLTCTPENNIFYDAILCYGQDDADYLSVYSKTYKISNLKYINFNRAPILKNDKPILLYLPTYSSSCSIDNIVDSLNSLKNDYYIITKSHHGTSYLNEELYRIEKIKNLSDEYYDQSMQLTDLLSQAHVVLSDNSGSIFEAIYAETPLAIFSEDLNKNKFRDFDTIQFELVKNGFIPYTNDATKISEILKQALSEEYIYKQKQLKQNLFYISENPINDFLQIIELYLNDNINKKYKALHDILIDNYTQKNIKINDLNNVIAEQNKKIESLTTNISTLEHRLSQAQDDLCKKDNLLSYYEKGKLYKISNYIYRKYHTLIGKGKNHE